jgi:hypothetical protein
MTKKPDLVVKLMAGDTLVDQSTDVGLWQRVLAEIRGVAPPPDPTSPVSLVAPAEQRTAPAAPRQRGASPVEAFAVELGIKIEELEGGLGPSMEAPFISLDDHSWETLKKHTGKRGPGAVSPAVLAATALTFWQSHAKFDGVTIQMVRATLETIHLEDANAGRSIGNCAWLQDKGGRIVPHPARKSSGRNLLRAFCAGEAPAEVGS